MTTPPLHPDFRAIIELLLRHGARFLVVGAHALAVAGRARATDDLDLFLEPTPANALAVAKVLREIGFTVLADAAAVHLAAPDRMLSVGRPPVEVDFLTSIAGVSFDEAWAGRAEVDVHGARVPFLGLRELAANKRAAGREKDLRDLALLEEAGLIEAARIPSRTKRKKKAKRKKS